jgi:hypothetical protein
MYMLLRLNRLTGLLLVMQFAGADLPAQTVYVSRMWHNHQPLYWPEWNSNGSQTNRIQYAWDSIVLKPGQTYGTGESHPDNNLTDIFGLADRQSAYQGRPRDALASINSAGGFCMSYSGSLIDNIRSLGAVNQLGYSSGWWDGNREARGWLTPSGSRRLDLVGFTYHHSLGPLLPKAVFRKELQTFKQAWWKAWGGNSNLTDHSKGFFPTEMAFSQSMIDVLVDEGYEWSIVASHHLSRTCPTYFNQFNLPASYGIYSSPPNKADQLGPSPTTGWWYGEPNPGNAAWNVSPFAYQLHKARYVNPENGAASEMLLVPSDDVLSYRFGYANEGIGKIQTHIEPFAINSARPVIVLPATDGDNAWGGGYDSWMVATPQYFSSSASAGYGRTAIQDFVDAHGAAAGTVHIEDGAWIFPESDYGSPYFLKWIEPPLKQGSPTTYPGTMVDLETPGFALKFWSWAPIITGANWCETAEQMLIDQGGSVQAWKIQAPYDWDGTWSVPNDVELGWHIYLGGLDSGFNYYGGLGNDDEVKPGLATTRAIEKLSTYVNGRLAADPANDQTPPSVLRPQRFPWNPGGYTFGWFNSIPSDNSYLKKMPSEFYIWTHAYDISGITSINVRVRIDNDGVNTMANDHNETYAGGSDVGAWITLPMTKRVLPSTRTELNAAANNGEIDYFITPPELADYYFVKITDANVPEFRGKLLDYYIEAADAQGNVSKSDIQHVYVEDDGSTPAGPPGIPTGVAATALSGSQIHISWTAPSNAATYIVKRDSVAVGTTPATEYTDSGLSPLTTYNYTVIASNSLAASAESTSAQATTHAPTQDFVMDGSPDYAGYQTLSSNLNLYAAVRGSKLYVATDSPAGTVHDRFIVISDALLPTASAPAHWAKAGTMAVDTAKPYLAGECDNGWAGWFNTSGSTEIYNLGGGVLEGTIDLSAEFGSVPSNIYLTVWAYETPDGGALVQQSPAGDGNGNIEPVEIFMFPVDSIRDTLSNGVFDRLDPARDFRISADQWSGSNSVLSWLCIPGQVYQPEYGETLTNGWQALGEPVPAESGRNTLSISNLTHGANMQQFYRIRHAGE